MEEVLRYDSPVQLTSRIGCDTRLREVTVAKGTEVIALLGAGNRDPRRFTDPNRFGAALARLEGAVAFPRLLRRFPNISPAGQPVRRDRLLLRGFETLPVTVS